MKRNSSSVLVTKSTEPETFSAFSESHCLTQGSLADAALAARRYLDQNPARRALILRDSTCRLVDLDLSGDEDLLVRKADHFMVPPSATTGPGSATSQEITLLPRHWEWLSTQGSSPSAVLRKLIDQARHDPQQQVDDLIRHHQNLTYRFCQALCGNLPNYEDAMRALFASDENGFNGSTSDWPQDLAYRARALAKPIWQAATL